MIRTLHHSSVREISIIKQWTGQTRSSRPNNRVPSVAYLGRLPWRPLNLTQNFQDGDWLRPWPTLQQLSSAHFGPVLEVCGYSIFATRPVPVAQDRYPYPYPTRTQNYYPT